MPSLRLTVRRSLKPSEGRSSEVPEGPDSLKGEMGRDHLLMLAASVLGGAVQSRIVPVAAGTQHWLFLGSNLQRVADSDTDVELVRLLTRRSKQMRQASRPLQFVSMPVLYIICRIGLPGFKRICCI